jgi:predicted Zn finger-like uncharacterized protein
MIIQCNSCQKSFNVPDNAITEKGRLVQCSACGNKWTQYLKISNKKEEKISAKKDIVKKPVIPKKSKKIKKPKKKDVNPYSVEYLQKKHGLKIIDPSSHNNKSRNIKSSTKIKEKTSLGFYNYLLIFIIFCITFFGVLNLTKDIIINNYPALKTSINYFYETLNYFKIIIIDILSRY